MASDQGFPTSSAIPHNPEYLDEELINLFGIPLAHESATRLHVPSPTKPSQVTGHNHKTAQIQSQPSVSSSCSVPRDLATTFPHNTIPIANPGQTHHIDLEPVFRSYVQRPEVIEAVTQAQSLEEALAAVSLTRNGRRYLRPPNANIIPVRFVEMLSQQQLDKSISSSGQKAKQLLSRYNKQRAVFDMLDGIASHQSNNGTREVLLQKLRDTLASLKCRIPLVSWDDFEMARDEAERRGEVWFAILLVRLVGVYSESQYIDLSDTSTKKFRFQENSYKKRCCEQEAWRVALQVLSHALNEEVQRLDRRVNQYLQGQDVPSESTSKTHEQLTSQGRGC